MRLINADALLEEINSFSMRITGSANAMALVIMDETKKSIAKMVDEQPAAYDMDNAVEELRDLLWDCYTDSGVGIDRETGFKAYEREMERIVKQNRR